MSKTGTTTLGKCFQILQFLPHKSSDRSLKKYYRKTKDAKKVIAAAKKYRSFEDAPWYLAFEELDNAYSKCRLIFQGNEIVTNMDPRIVERIA